VEQQSLLELLKHSKTARREIVITVFGKEENRPIHGIVTGLDPRLHLVKVETKADWHLIDLAKVVKVSLVELGT
jgi:hypothetical protein